MEMCKLSLFFVLVVTVMLSLCDANDTARDERLEELMEMLQQQSEQLNSHSLQNTQIIRHLADIAEQLQDVVRVGEEQDGQCLNVNNLRQEFSELTSILTNNNKAATAMGTDCGSMLLPVPTSVRQAPEGWVLCHLTNPDAEQRDTTCKDLLVGLRGNMNSQRLLESGGNFGCWKSSTGPSGINPRGACRANVQHSHTMNRGCPHCNTLGVCVFYPSEQP